MIWLGILAGIVWSVGLCGLGRDMTRWGAHGDAIYGARLVMLERVEDLARAA
jgi:hypothetical protein